MPFMIYAVSFSVSRYLEINMCSWMHFVSFFQKSKIFREKKTYFKKKTKIFREKIKMFREKTKIFWKKRKYFKKKTSFFSRVTFTQTEGRTRDRELWSCPSNPYTIVLYLQIEDKFVIRRQRVYIYVVHICILWRWLHFYFVKNNSKKCTNRYKQ